MPEGLAESGSSQGSGRTNPRLRNTQRVRAVPYECCGGFYNFFSTGCFTMCCAGQKTRRNSAFGRRNSKRKEKISEPPKRLIKPNIGDGLTETEKDEFKTSDPILFYPNDDELPGGLYVSKFDIELDEVVVTTTDQLEQENDSILTLNDDNVSHLTTDISVAGSEVSGKVKKGKKKLVNILRFRKKKKNADDLSTTSSNASFAQSDNAAETQSNIETSNAATKQEVLTNIEEIETVDLVLVEEIQETTTNIVVEGKVDDVQAEPKQGIVNESDFIKIAKILPLGASATKQELLIEPEANEIGSETPEPSQEKRKKKSFWRSSSRKGKNKDSDNLEVMDGSKSDSEKNATPKKSFLGKWGSLKRTQSVNATESGNVENEDNDELTVTESENEAPKTETKKKTLFGTLKLSKKNKGKDQKNVFNVCTTSTVEKTASSESVEVKTIESYEGTLEDDSCPIKIIRNQFFLAEINCGSHNRNNCNKNDDVGDTGKSNAGDEVNNLDSKSGNVEDAKEDSRNAAEIREDNLEDNARGVSVEMIKKDDSKNATEGETKGVYGEKEEGNSRDAEPVGVELAKDSLRSTSAKDDKVSLDHEKPEQNESTSAKTIPSEKQYGIIDKEDFSESLHTLVDNDPDYIIIASSDAIFNTNFASKSEVTSLPDDMFRSSYATSIDGSIQDAQSQKTEGNFEIFAMSTDTLVVHTTNDSVIERSTDTLTGTKEEKQTIEWVEVANVDQLNDSQFGYIYKTTMKKLEDDARKIEETSSAGAGGSSGGSKECSQCDVGVKCICTTLTQVRHSVGELEEGNVKTKIETYNHAEHPIISPLGWQHDTKDTKDDVIISEAHSSPTLGSKTGSKSATPSPIAAKSRSGTLSSTNSEWQHAEEDIDRMMVMQGRSSLSSLGLRSDSMASVYSGAGEGRYGTVTVRGHVEFGLQYNYKAGALEIHVKQCKDLAPVDTKRNRSDPYVKVYLLPDKSKGGKRKTKVKKHTLNPVFDETLKFHISLNGLETRTLWLTVWHSDMFGRNDFLGEVMMTLENKVFDDPTPKLYNLQERTEPFDDTISFKGDIIVCLKFVPPDMTVQKKGKRSRGTLHVLVKEAKYLTAYKANGTSDPFCKSYLLPDKGRNSKQKTAVVKKTVNPVWNHTFIYDDVTLQELAERCLELTVWDHDRLASNEFLGGIRFSLGTGKHYGKAVEWMDSSGKEVSLWKNMLERPNFWVEGSLSLRPTLDARTS